MQRNRPETGPDPRHGAERDAAQPIGGQPRSGDHAEETQKPDEVPSFLTARELQAREPAKGGAGAKPAPGKPKG